jgi:O-antigen/teichoic acid export membrane protein
MAILTSSVSMIMIPELARRLAKPVEFGQLFRIFRVATLLYCAVVTALAWPIGLFVIALVGNQYAGAISIVIGMVIGAGISGVSQAYNAKLLAMGLPNPATRAVVAGAVVGLLCILGLGWQRLEAELWVVPVASELVVVTLMILAARLSDARPREPASDPSLAR